MMGIDWYKLKRNLKNRLQKTNDPSITRYQCADFDFNTEILKASKSQPAENASSTFEVENEKELKCLSGDIIIITDK